MRRLTWLLLATAAVAVVALAAACGDDNNDEGDDGDLATLPVARGMTVEMRDLAFEPARMSVRAGDVVEMTFHNSGAQLHDFTIDQMDAEVMEMTPGGGAAAQEHMDDDMPGMPMAMHMAVEAGHEGVMRMRIHEPGEYEYYCTVPGHREAGMSGMLTVE